MNICKTKGATLTDHDQAAQHEAESGIEPNVTLLRARLLCDGGFYQQALIELSGKKEDFSRTQDKIEFIYRLARIYHLWGKVDESIPYYKATIETGKNYPYYFAANAALCLGDIYKQKNEIEEAKKYYEMCLTMKNTEYKTGIDQKAKAALNSLNVK